MKIFEKLKEQMRPSNAKMKMCMMGARGVGKTSILTSMFKNINAVNSLSNLQMTTLKNPDGNMENATLKIISERYNQLVDMFNNADLSTLEVKNAGIAASFEVTNFYFQFGEKGKATRIDLEIKDFPGEYIYAEPEAVEEFLSEANAVMIAIDTPHMMECDGIYNESKNHVSDITEFFKKTFLDLNEDKMVLFVPLKCEKYFLEGTMDKVLERTLESYAELIEFFGQRERKAKIACAVTPILTVGEIVFDDFERTENGEVAVLENTNLPIKSKYKFINQNAEYSPRFCEQPLSYFLSFVLKLYERSKHDVSNMTLLQRVGEMLKLFPNDPNLLMECRKFSSQKIKSGNGYKIIQNETKF